MLGVGPDAAADLTLDHDDEAARRRRRARVAEPAAQALIDATLRYADLDEVVVAADTTRRGGPPLLVQRCAGAPARCSAVVEVGYGDRAGLPAAARDAWQAVRTGELRYPPVVLADRGATGVAGGGCRACRSPWLWTGVGAALVTGIAITIVAASASRPPPSVAIDPGAFTSPR